MGWNHISRQHSLQGSAHVGGDDRLVRGGNQISDQERGVAVAAWLRYNQGFTDGGMPAQRRLNLSRFNAKTAQLDLMVCPPQKLQSAIRQTAHQVARTVQALARSRKSEGMRQKTGGCQARTLVIAARQTDAANV